MRGLLWKHMRFSGTWSEATMDLVYPLDVPDEPPKDFEYRVGGPSIGDAHVRIVKPSSGPVGPMTPYEPGQHPMPAGKTKALWEGMGFDGSVEGYKPPEEWKIQRFIHEPPPMEFVLKRGITKEAYKVWELGHDVYRRRLVFPCRNADEELVGFTTRLYWEGKHCFKCGRSIIDDERTAKRREKKPDCEPVLIYKCECRMTYSKYWHWPGKWRRHSVYGVNLYEGGPIVVVEGSTDAIRLWTLGVRSPMAIFGSFPNPEQVRLIGDLGGHVYLLGDGDKAGRKMHVDFVQLAEEAGFVAHPIELPILEKKVDPDNAPEKMLREILPDFLFAA